MASIESYSTREIVLNHETSTDHEAVIDFGQAKTHLLINIYNWRYPLKVTLLALADITACFRLSFRICCRVVIFHIDEPRFWFEHVGQFLGTSPSSNQKYDNSLRPTR